jgi:cytoskeleton protein RodZ
VPTVLVDPVVRERGEAPPLVASGTISHSRYLYQRYSVSALYLILTGVIIVPAVMLAMRASLQPNVGQVAALDAPATARTNLPLDAGGSPNNGADAPARAATSDASPPPPPAAEAPLMASLAPFAALAHKEPVAQRADPPPSGTHTLKLSLKEASWVEVTATNGEKLEYGLLPAGAVRTYTSDKALEVRLGNCSGAEVETDGAAQDLTPYRHANVARFRLFSAGEPISRTDS